MTLFHGKCIGGPFHGKSLYHGEPRMEIAICGGKVVTYFGVTNEEIQMGSYECENDAWIWKDPVSK